MQLISRRRRGSELNQRAVEKRLDTLQGRKAPALLTHYVLQELTRHVPFLQILQRRA
jgi:hypothetical protein